MLKIDGISNNDVYLIGDIELESKEECFSKELEDSRLFVKKTNIDGIFTYGSQQTCEEYLGHTKGYVWSSRASVMNKAFNTTLIEAYYKAEDCPHYNKCSIDLMQFEQLLKEAEYDVEWVPIMNTDLDVQYSLKKRKAESTI